MSAKDRLSAWGGGVGGIVLHIEVLKGPECCMEATLWSIVLWSALVVWVDLATISSCSKLYTVVHCRLASEGGDERHRPSQMCSAQVQCTVNSVHCILYMTNVYSVVFQC